ncbi:MAG: cytochrome c peroxidase [Thermoflexibacter sp.]
MKCFLNISILLIFAFSFCSCQPSSEAELLHDYIPYFADSLPVPLRNPLTTAGVNLGKALFFDTHLSGNKQVSCASCHLPSQAFADTVALSTHGISGKPLVRNTPTLLNLAWTQQGLFWDGGAKDIESLVFAPLRHADEMGQDLSQLPPKLRALPYYPTLFKKAFQQDTITNAMIARALAQYVRTLTFANSRYDEYAQGKIQFTHLELQGLQIFQKKCATCHPPPLFTDNLFHNIGLDSMFIHNEENMHLGRYRITLDSLDIGKFKTPTLRQWALTFPYMHDGRFKNINEVLFHYQTNMKKNPYLDPLFIQADGKVGIPLTQEEINALLAFLQTL